MATATQPEDDRARHDALQVLLSDYYVAREDEQQFQTILATMISIAVALLGAIIVVFYQSCDLNSSENCLRIRPIVYAGLPFGPLVVLAYIGVLANVAAVRSFYLRALERRLHEYADQGSVPLQPLHLPGRVDDSLPIPMFMHLVHVVTSQRHGFFRYRYLTFLFYIAMAVMFFGVTATSLVLSKSIVLQVVMGLAYGGTTVVFLIVLWSGSVGGRELWQRLISRLDEARREPLVVHDRVPARLWGYLVLPRPAELVAKGVFIPLTTAIAAAVFSRGNAPRVLEVVVFVVAFEYLMYQARYMLNDIRDLDEDAKDPLAGARNRLPQPMSGWMLRVTLGVLLTRVLVWALAVAWLWRSGLGAALLISGITIFVIAGLYEELRDRVRARTDESGKNILGLGRGKLAIYIVVGFGYALRAVTGIWIGGQGGTGMAILALTALTTSALGTMFVAMTWVVAGTSFIDPLPVALTEPTDGVEPVVPQNCSRSLIYKSHYGPLLAQAGLLKKQLKLVESVNGATSERPFLRDSNHRLNTIWNIALVTSAGGAGSLGLLLAHGPGSPPLLLALPGFAVGAAGSAAVVMAGPRPVWQATARWLIAALLLGAVARLAHQQYWWIGPIALAAVCLVYLFFCWSRADDLVKWSAWPTLAYAFAGRNASRILHHSAEIALGSAAVKILQRRDERAATQITTPTFGRSEDVAPSARARGSAQRSKPVAR